MQYLSTNTLSSILKLKFKYSNSIKFIDVDHAKKIEVGLEIGLLQEELQGWSRIHLKKSVKILQPKNAIFINKYFIIQLKAQI